MIIYWKQEPGSKPVCQAVSEYQGMAVHEAYKERELSDVDCDVLNIFRECKVCIHVLDQIISNHSVIDLCYNESEST